MTQSIKWESITNKTTITFGVLHRCKVKGGWLISDKPSLTSTSSKLMEFVPDPSFKWNTPELTWETLVNSGVSLGTTLRARVSDGWLIGHILGTVVSSRSLTFLSDTVGDWLADPILQTIDPISSLVIDIGQPVVVVPTVKNPSNLSLTFACSNLPNGLTIDPLNGKIVGVPTIVAVSSLVIQVSSTIGIATSNTFTITVNALPIPVPPPPTPIPVTNKWIGTNLMPVTDYSTDFPFLNYFQKSRDWLSGTWNVWDDGRALDLDVQGNVLSLIGTGDQQAKSVLFSGKRPAGVYILTWTGNGSITVQGVTGVTQTPGKIVMTVPDTGNIILLLTAVDAINPIKNIKLVRKEQETETGLFNPDFVADMKKYACIRFMDWQCTNFNRSAASMAKDFAPLTALPIRFTSQPNSVPVEVMIELCNQTDTDAWFCMPIQASSGYIDQFLALVQAKLKPSLRCYVEHSNEIWNGGFPQNTLQGGANFTEKMTLHALATSTIAGKVKAVLGSRGLTVLGGQSPNIGTQEPLLTTIKNTVGATMPDALATAPYFGYGLPDDVAIFTDGRLNTSIQGVIKEVVASKAVADKFGISLVCYEGGSTVIPGSVVNRDPRMGDAYLTYLHGIKAANPGKLFNHYAYTSAYNQFGSWGEKEFQYQVATGKSQAIATVIAE